MDSNSCRGCYINSRLPRTHVSAFEADPTAHQVLSSSQVSRQSVGACETGYAISKLARVVI